MSFKNKIIALVMSFVICFGTVFNSFANEKEPINNIQPLVVDGGVLSAPMLATVAGLAVGAGVVISNNDDLYDLGRMFYDYIDKNNDLTLELVKSVFSASVSLKTDKLVSVKKDFLDIVKDFLDTTFSDVPVSNIPISVFDGITSIPITNDILKLNYKTELITLDLSDNVRIRYKLHNDSSSLNGYNFDFNMNVDYYLNGKWNPGWGTTYGTSKISSLWNSASIERIFYNGSYHYALVVDGKQFIMDSVSFLEKSLKSLMEYNSIDFPYNGGYTWDNVESKKENDSVALPVPGNLGQLVGQGSTDFWDNTDGLAGGGSISLPGVDFPSIDVTDDVFVGSPSTDVPGVGNPDVPGVENPSIPNDSIWSTIKDFVVSLVVPSDTFWTDTFNGFRDNFSKNFPMLDMSKFDSLAVGGKPFPNLYAYGSKIVDGDVINSIVDWLRPIIAGFIMICLMFFNYRKIYKLIRNTEPFGGIAQGSSDFRTGLSAPPINNGLDSNPMGNLRDTLFDMRNEILRRENEK